MQRLFEEGENMEMLSFRQSPLVVKIAVGVAFFNAWLSFEELFINRHGLWKYMPFYRVAGACVWDLVVALTISFAIWRASRSSARH